MTKHDFLSRLERQLGGIPAEDKREILYDYEEHFRIGMEQGNDEAAIAESLGEINVIAKQFKADYALKKAETDTSLGNTLKAVYAALGLGFFNLVFVLGPFMGLVGVLIGLIGAAVGITVSGIAGMVAVMAAPFYPTLIAIGANPAFVLFVSIGLTSLGLLFLIGDYYLARIFYKGLVIYLKWNMGVISRQEATKND
ncbi:MAG: HAAS signaling domain-containing protein [Bacillota bacterium]